MSRKNMSKKTTMSLLLRAYRPAKSQLSPPPRRAKAVNQRAKPVLGGEGSQSFGKLRCPLLLLWRLKESQMMKVRVIWALGDEEGEEDRMSTQRSTQQSSPVSWAIPSLPMQLSRRSIGSNVGNVPSGEKCLVECTRRACLMSGIVP
jgi:hypothetical protein